MLVVSSSVSASYFSLNTNAHDNQVSTSLRGVSTRPTVSAPVTSSRERPQLTTSCTLWKTTGRHLSRPNPSQLNLISINGLAPLGHQFSVRCLLKGSFVMASVRVPPRLIRRIRRKPRWYVSDGMHQHPDCSRSFTRFPYLPAKTRRCHGRTVRDLR